MVHMSQFSSRQAAKQLGITHVTLIRYIELRKIPAPKAFTSGDMTIHLWTEEDIERVRQLLPKIANGRKTRWQRQRAAQQTSKGSSKNRTAKKKKK